MPSPLSSVLSLSKSRSTDVQLAACLWYYFGTTLANTPIDQTPSATYIIRASGTSHSIPSDDASALTVLSVVNRMIATTDSPQTRTKACFILCAPNIYIYIVVRHPHDHDIDHLVTDDATLCHTAFLRGSLEKLANLVQSITPLENHTEWDEDESESVSCLREVGIPFSIHSYLVPETIYLGSTNSHRCYISLR